jgi:hypothetical protein
MIKLVGSFLGILAFFWKLIDAFKSYLHISINIKEVTPNYAFVKLEVDNRNFITFSEKKIDNAILLIGPESEKPKDIFNKISEEKNLNKVVISTNEIAEYRPDSDIYTKNGRAIIPLPFFFSENIRIADENPTYTVAIKLQYFEKNKIYSVRFFISTKSRLHRTTQDCFLVK